MNYPVRQTAFLLLISALFLFGCTKRNTNSPATPVQNASTIITSGTWRITYYHENSSDHTSNFSGYTFTFNTNGTMTAAKSSNTTSGTWSIDDSKNECHLSIGTTSPLSDLNNGWTIILKTTIELDMKDDNSSNNEEVHFSKN